MILTTTETISGKELETLGLVKGSTIQTVNAVRDIGAGLKTLVGGELTRYNEMMNDARALATKRMVAEAEGMGADAIVCIRYGRRCDCLHPLQLGFCDAERRRSNGIWYCREVPELRRHGNVRMQDRLSK